MRGSPVYQAHELFEKSGISQIGESKHDAKELAREAGARAWGEIGRALGVHSYATADVYRDAWRHCLVHARENSGVKDIEKLTGEHISAYLADRIDKGVHLATYRQEAAALGKLETALNRYADGHGTGRVYDFRSAIAEHRKLANTTLARFEGSRAYSAPRELVRAAPPQFSLAARFQYESGGRIREVCHIHANQLRGISVDPHTGKEWGSVVVQGKGGQEYTLHPTPATYRELAQHIERVGHFEVHQNTYRAALKEASSATAQDYHGSHGLRWNHAQERMVELQNSGMVYETAMAIVSEELNHHRADITLHYQR